MVVLEEQTPPNTTDHGRAGIDSVRSAPIPPAPHLLSIVVLTWNEERNIRACLESLAKQTTRDFEVIVVDAASTDHTAEIVREIAHTFPVPLTLELATTRLTVGVARNRGVQLADADVIAFLSADAEAQPEWAHELLQTIATSDIVYGRQVHAPPRRSLGATVRGLRYHFPEGGTDDAARYASHVSAGIRREVLQAFPFGTTKAQGAVDDILLAHRSRLAGCRIQYNANMVVRHRDVDSARQEFVKNLREGQGWGELSKELGPHHAIISWSILLLSALILVLGIPHVVTLAFLIAAIYAPSVRRVLRRRKDMDPLDLVVGGLVSPAFDLVFLFGYFRGRLDRRRLRNERKKPSSQLQETNA